MALVPVRVGAAAAVPVVACYRLKSVGGDYLTCRTWDGATEGGADVYVAKVHKLRHSITAEIIESIHYNYTYGTWVNTRNLIRKCNLDDTTFVEDCLVTPEWIVDDLIFAITCDFTGVTVGGSQLTLLMLGDGRSWAVH